MCLCCYVWPLDDQVKGQEEEEEEEAKTSSGCLDEIPRVLSLCGPGLKSDGDIRTKRGTRRQTTL